MKENVMEVLMYVFEHFYETDNILSLPREEIETMLDQVGFPEKDIKRSMCWLDELVDLCDQAEDNSIEQTSRTRMISPQEQQVMTVECQGYLLELEQHGILDDLSREMVIDRAMALSTSVIALKELQWVVQMVLFNLPGRPYDYAFAGNTYVDNDQNQLLWH